MKKMSAFTLAETLVVIGIIGVVAALTLPNLNSSTGEKEKVVQIKKTYQNLTDAIGRAEAVYGPFKTWFGADGDDRVKKSLRVGQRVTQFMKVSKDCGQARNAGCFSQKDIPSLNWGSSESSTDMSMNDYKIIAADGTSIGFGMWSDGLEVVVDIDGPIKGPNVKGKDRFKFVMDNKGSLVPFGYAQTTNDALKTVCFGMGEGCTAWVIKNENMDYLKADQNGKCPNGTVLTWEQTTCK